MSSFELSDSYDGQRARSIDDPSEVASRLRALHPDLTIALFHKAIFGGLASRNEIIPASAPTAAGVQQWLKTVEDLRRLLAALRWHLHSERNCPFISSPDRTVSVVVMTGNSETGKNGFEDPANQAEKGAVAENFVQENWRQLELFNQRSLEAARKAQATTQVWALLYHYDKVLNEVRFELSLPTAFSRRKITRWGERLLLGNLPNNPDDFIVRTDLPNAPATVEVAPKTGTF